MALELMNPSVILFRGDVFRTLCVQSVGSGENSQLQLQPVDPTGNTTSQLWQYGSDQRIYQYDGTGNPSFCIGLQGAASEEQGLILVKPSGTDQTQRWSFSTTAPSLINVANPGYCVNDQFGHGNQGDLVIIYANSETNNTVWAFSIYPSFPGQPT